MLGYTGKDSNVFVFFENDEIERLEKEKLQGLYFNSKYPYLVGQLEAAIDDAINDRIKTSGTKNDEGNFILYRLLMKRREYESFNERRTYGLHEGFRHVNLIDANNLDFNDKLNYMQLCHYRSQHEIDIHLKTIKS